MMDYTEEMLQAAYDMSSNHKPELEKDSVCGCFYCLTIYSPKEITEWVIEDTDIDWRGTAICPHCDVDSVIGESSGFPITREFLQAMHDRWFSDKTPLTNKADLMKSLFGIIPSNVDLNTERDERLGLSICGEKNDRD